MRRPAAPGSPERPGKRESAGPRGRAVMKSLGFRFVSIVLAMLIADSGSRASALMLKSASTLDATARLTDPSAALTLRTASTATDPIEPVTAPISDPVVELVVGKDITDLRDELVRGDRNVAIASNMGDAEWALDAPWRLEPPYTVLPINFSIHDVADPKDRAVPWVARFC